jgi:transcriptional regulator with XRE-family HTH domain
VYQVLRKRICEIREAADLTQRELADLLKRDRSYVWKCEQGERRMDAIDLIRWCHACKANPANVFKQLVIAERSRNPEG